MTARLIFDRILVYGVALILALWVLAPLYLITIAAFSPQATAYDFPKQLLPTTLSAETMQFFLNSRGVVPSIINSLVVALLTILIALTLGTPAGYALARFRFRGRDAFSVLVLTTRMFPVAILSIPLAVASRTSSRRPRRRSAAPAGRRSCESLFRSRSPASPRRRSSRS